jgi:hypothetical protein
VFSQGIVLIWAAKTESENSPFNPVNFLKTGHLPSLVDYRYANYYLEVHSIPTAITGLDAHLRVKLAVEPATETRQ